MRQLKIIATLVGGLLAAVVLGYLALLFINRHDQPPSQDALHLAELYRDRPLVVNADNGYLYAMDFPESGDLFDRYRRLLSHSGWRQPKPLEATPRFPTHGEISQGQELLLLRAAELADSGDIAGVHDLLAEDVRFWRMVLGSSDLLIDKMIAVVMLDRHFELANLALRRLSAKRALEAMPREWGQELTAPERSLTRALVGEWVFVDASFRRTKAGEPAIYRPLFQPQDSSNKLAAILVRAARDLDVPYEKYPQVLRHMQAEANQGSAEPGIFADLYNLVGSMTPYVPKAFDYGRYAVRVTDVEGARRAAVLATILRSKGVSAEDVPAQLAATEIRDPYTNGPFAWDLKEAAIVFTGLVPGERGRHDFKY